MFRLGARRTIHGMTDLWAEQRKATPAAEPLAVRMRPRTLDEFLGQEHFLGPGKLLRRMLDADRLTSVIFYGPPGTGKTTLAEVDRPRDPAVTSSAANAASVGVKEVRRDPRRTPRAVSRTTGRRTILFLDEIHRFARNQQDVLLADVENGLITLIGATTENPYFAVNSALVSRSTVFQFEPLSEDDIAALLRRAAVPTARLRGISSSRSTTTPIAHWAARRDGDARRALNALEVAVLSQTDRAGPAAGAGP